MCKKLPTIRAVILPLACLMCAVATAQTADEPAAANPDRTSPTQPADSDSVPTDPFPDAVRVPAGIMDGGTEWLNTSGPIDLKELRGKVVLLDFWTYCCINCIHVLPDLKYLEDKYKDELVVIGVHSAKFDNEKLSDNIRDAILRYEIKHPVVNDSEMLIWRKFATRAWPTLALIDPEGRFLGSQGGEGNRELFDRIIGRVVDYHRHKGTLDEDPLVFDLEVNDTKPTALRYPGKLLAHAASGRLFISDSNHNRIVITDLDGHLQDIIGNGQTGREDGGYDVAEFDHPQGMELVGNTLYVADTENHLIRAIDLEAKNVSTLAGTGRQGRPRDVDGDIHKTNLNSPWALCHVDGTLFIAMAGPHQIWSHKLGTQTIEVHAGNAREDIINGSLTSASFAQPSGLTADSSGTYIFVADSEGSAIRQVAVAPGGSVTTIAGTSELPRGQSLFAFGDVDATGADARFQHPLGVAWHDDRIFVADSYNHKVRRIDVKTGSVESWLGDGTAGDTLSPVRLSEPAGLSIANDRLYIADTNNHRILSVNLESKDTTVLEIGELTAPVVEHSKRSPPPEKTTTAEPQSVNVGDKTNVVVRLMVRDGYKLNPDYPVTWEIFVIEGDQIIAPAALEGRDEALAVDGTAEFNIPMTGNTGSATVIVEVGYGYCGAENAKLCRLANHAWKLTLSVTEDADNETLKLQFPAVESQETKADTDE